MTALTVLVALACGQGQPGVGLPDTGLPGDSTHPDRETSTSDGHGPADLADSHSDWDDAPHKDGLTEIPDVPPPAPEIVVFNLVEQTGMGLSLGVQVHTNVPTRLVMRMQNVAHAVTGEVASVVQFGTQHQTAILMMRPDTEYLIHAEVTDNLGRTTQATKPWKTSPLPDGFPVVKLRVTQADKMSPGLTLVSAINPYLSQGFFFLLDSKAEVVFYKLVLLGFVVPGSDGQLVTNGGPLRPLCGSSLWGSTSFCKQGSDFDVAVFHHLHGLTPEGHILALGLEARTLTDCPAYAGFNLVGDVLVEFTTAGQLVRRFSLMDALGNERLCLPEERCNDAWDSVFPAQSPTKDRTHCNSVAIDPTDGNYVVSCHHVHLVAKLHRQTGALMWTLGQTGDFQLLPPGRWPFRHHSAVPQADGRLLLYDNQPATAPFQARAVEYQLTPSISPGTPGVAEQTWEYSTQPPVPSERSNALGEVHRLPNGNVLVVDSVIDEVVALPGDQGYNPDNHVKGRISEVTYPNSNEVFQVEIVPPEGMEFGLWVVSAQRLPAYGQGPP